MGSEKSGTRGKTNNPNGRPKGVPNKVTTDIREEFRNFLDHASQDIIDLFDQLKADNPKQALDSIKDYAEFVLPKLARTEYTGLDGEEIKVDHNVTVKFLNGNSNTE